MSYTFGGATGDDLTYTGRSSFGTSGSGSTSLMCGWFYPTTLTAGRFLFSRGSVMGLSIASTTSELSWTADYTTTDGVWSTTDAGIVVNKWHFIACLASYSTAPEVRFWVGTMDNGLRQCSTTQTTGPSGTLTGASTSVTIGNRGSAGTVAFQGNISEVFIYTITTANTFGMYWLNVPNPGITASAAENEYVYTSFILPLFHGRPPSFTDSAPAGLNSAPDIQYVMMNTGVGSVKQIYASGTVGANDVTGTASGVVVSQNDPPVRYNFLDFHRPPRPGWNRR